MTLNKVWVSMMVDQLEVKVDLTHKETTRMTKPLNFEAWQRETIIRGERQREKQGHWGSGQQGCQNGQVSKGLAELGNGGFSINPRVGELVRLYAICCNVFCIGAFEPSAALWILLII